MEGTKSGQAGRTERRRKLPSSRPGRKGARGWSRRAPERPRPTSPPLAAAGMAEHHSQLQALRHRLPSVSGDHPPPPPHSRPARARQRGGLQAGPSGRLLPGPLPPPSSPVTPRRLDSGPPPPRTPHLSDLPSSLLPAGAEVTEASRTRLRLPSERSGDDAGVPALSGPRVPHACLG